MDNFSHLCISIHCQTRSSTLALGSELRNDLVVCTSCGNTATCQWAILRVRTRPWVSGCRMATSIRRQCRRGILNSALPIEGSIVHPWLCLFAAEWGKNMFILLYRCADEGAPKDGPGGLLICHRSSLGRTTENNSPDPLCCVASRV